MTDVKPEQTSMSLLASGKSSRLLEMRKKSRQASADNLSAENGIGRPATQSARNDVNPQLLLAQQLIDRRLADILAGFPAGRQRSLFKIRYGIDPEKLKQQPIDHIAKLLNISHPLFINPRGDTKKVLELTYTGQQASIPPFAKR
ncbi:hypothetical protein [Methylomonas methanica]|uniref:Uncharacterized protein n=1 Tax=Methylomonas methanica (strain DSM 25384 / MC09) TaxID=857087 RepID=G0A0X5_METMM|nr:hypothetical protein [Methylomonas methanica]AEG01231.1 hypothetical protein Metme_2850 [Methylomonas methanica MC09]